MKERVEVFKTNVTNDTEADVVIRKLKLILPEAHINFDLEDCDKILRIALTDARSNNVIIQTLTNLGFDVVELP